MFISPEKKEAVITSVSIELVRAFTVLSNQYSGPQFHEHASLLPAIEARMTACLRSITQDQLATDIQDANITVKKA
jgi:hypothetical protein